VKIYSRGKQNRGVMDLLLCNVRTPEERRGDLEAQLAANSVGARRLQEILAKYEPKEVTFYLKQLQSYARRMMQAAIKEIPDGTYSFEDFMDDDGVDSRPVKIRVAITVKGGDAVVDFTGSDPQVKGSINACYSITLSVVFYVFRCLARLDIPSNSGCMEPITVITPGESIVDADFPSAVAGGNVETSQRIADVLFGALSRALPDRIPAASSGTMNNITIGGYDPAKGAGFTYYETIGGGMGGRPDRDGVDAVQTHMTNTLNTPIEAIAHAYPFRIVDYSIRKGSGGEGRFSGGCGIRREYELLCDAQVTILSERREHPPYGLDGGQPGETGSNRLVSGKSSRALSSKVNLRARKGDRIVILTPGGGGFGRTASND
jgi:N-methylhydantoinase B